MKTSARRPARLAAKPAAAVLDAHPAPTLLLDARLVVVQANAAARRLLGVRERSSLEDVLGCAGPAAGGCAEGARCGGCAVRRAIARALRGEAARERGFLLRSGARGEPADLHLLAFATPFVHRRAPHAIVALLDANALLADPGLVRVCEGCGRVQDEEGAWHPLHRYLEDRLGLEGAGVLCGSCDP